MHTSTPSMNTPQSEFFNLIERNSQSVLQYDNYELKKYARNLIPYENLLNKTINRLRDMQKMIKTQNKHKNEPCLNDLFLIELVNWFNTQFFEWINVIPCKICGKSDNDSLKSSIENGIRVELNICCEKKTKFYRYNDIKKLLQTRKGRCGEYANCFTFLCNALGYDSRLIHSEFDHVWTEVYSYSQKRWLHIDPSENLIDAPLVYQHGWKRKIDYIIAFSIDDIQDVTWRYTSNFNETLKLRNKCTEIDLIDTIIKIRNKRQYNLKNLRKIYLKKRCLSELVDLMKEKQPTENEKKGRSSGDLIWKIQRGENLCNNFYIFEADKNDIKFKQFNLRYSCVHDKYEKYIKNDNKINIIWSMKNWQNCLYSCCNIFRKIEKDWKMVYLARTEGSDYAEISWKFDFSKTNLKIKEYLLKFETKTYENGEILINIKNNNDNSSNIIDSNGFTIIATLMKGKGDMWQHTQLFRQNLNSCDFPFDLNVIFY